MPESVATVFRERGHTVVLVRDILPVDSPDPLVATVSEEDDLILVSCDRDFKVIAPRIPLGKRARYRKLSRISLHCNEHQAAQRVEIAMSLIETEYEDAQGSRDKRMFIEILNSSIKTHR